MESPADLPTVTRPYAGETARHYQRLSDLGLAPQVLAVSATEIVSVQHQTLEEWLALDPSQVEKDSMATRICDMLREVHEKAEICHRDVHVGNIVLDDEGIPLLIGPKWAVEVVNDHCYDLEGPVASGVAVPQIHIDQLHNGVWWGSDVTHRALQGHFGPPPA